MARKSQEDARAEDMVERKLPERSQFAREIDHFSECVQAGCQPHTPGEEGLQDMRIIEVLYRSAKEGKSVKLEAVGKQDAFHGPPPTAEG